MPVQMTITDREPEEKPTRYKVNLTRLSHSTRYSLSHLSRVFARKTNPSVPCLRAIAIQMGLTMDEVEKAIKERRVTIADQTS